MNNVQDKMIQELSKSFGDLLARVVCTIISFVAVFQVFVKFHQIILANLDNEYLISLIYCLEFLLFIATSCAASLVLMRGIEWLQKDS